MPVQNDEKLPFEKEIILEEPKQKKDVAIVRQSPPPPLLAQQDGTLVGSTLDEQYRLASLWFRSGIMPAAFNSPEKILVALQICYELKIPPMSSMKFICIINGAAYLYGDLPLGIVKRSKLLVSIKEAIFDKDGKEISLENKNQNAEAVGAYCTVTRVGDEPVTRSFTKADAEKAKLWGNKVWAVYPKRMLQMRARSHALKDVFPDVLMGMGILEYDKNTTIEMVEKTGGGGDSVVDALNKTYHAEENA